MRHQAEEVNDADTRPRWTARDLLLRNEFCPTSQINDFLSARLEPSDDSWMIAFPFDRRSLLKSLAAVVATDPGYRKELESSIRTQHFLIDSRAAKLTSDDIVRFFRIRLSISAETPLSARRSHGPGEANGTIGCWILGPRSAVDALSKDDVDFVAEMVSGTARANSVRDGRISEMIRDVSSKTSNFETMHESAAAILSLASSISQADCRYYRFDPQRNTLLLGEAAGIDRTGVTVPREIPVDSTAPETMAREAFRRSRTFVEGPDAAERRHPAAYVPVPSAPIGRRVRNTGVLVVTRTVSEDPGEFSWYELALLRNIALRLALLEADSTSSGASRELASLMGALASPTDLRWRTDARVPPAQSRFPPADFEHVRTELERVASHLLGATRSDTVSIRSLVPVTTADGAGLVLQRFLAMPPERLKAEPNQIDVSTDRGPNELGYVSANAKAASHGRVHVWDSKEPLENQSSDLLKIVDTDGIRPRSEVAVPIICDSLTIGTINLESSVPYNYVGKLDLIDAFAAAAGITIAMGRREILRAVAETFSVLRLGPHERNHLSDALDLLRDHIPADNKALRVLERITVAADTGEFESKLPADDVRLTEIISDASRRARDPSVTPESYPDLYMDEAEYMMPSSTKSVLTEAFRELFTNIYAETMPTLDHPERGVRIITNSTVLGGEAKVVVKISNWTAMKSADPRFLQSLYHLPIPDSAGLRRPHLGAFIIGQLVRSVGGNVYAAWVQDEFSTFIVVPFVSERLNS